MRRILRALTATALCIGPSGALSSDHLVAPGALSQRVAAAAARREADIRAVEAVLGTPQAAAAAAALGTGIDAAKRAVPALTDVELRDLAERASALRTDPASGHIDADLNDVLVIFLVAAIIVVMLAAVD